MKIENNNQVIRKSRSQRSTEPKVVAVRAWTPQPNPLTREEIRRIVIDQIG